MWWPRWRAPRHPFGRSLLVSALLVVAYYVTPVRLDASGLRLLARTLLVVAILLAVAAFVRRLVIRRDESGATASGLLVALVGGVVTFALVDYLVAVDDPGQFEDLRTRTDALYFAVTTLTTTGYGDIHARGQLARALVTGQLVYNVAVLATGVSALVNRLTGHWLGRGRPPEGPPA